MQRVLATPPLAQAALRGGISVPTALSLSANGSAPASVAPAGAPAQSALTVEPYFLPTVQARASSALCNAPACTPLGARAACRRSKAVSIPPAQAAPLAENVRELLLDIRASPEHAATFDRALLSQSLAWGAIAVTVRVGSRALGAACLALFGGVLLTRTPAAQAETVTTAQGTAQVVERGWTYAAAPFVFENATTGQRTVTGFAVALFPLEEARRFAAGTQRP